MEISLDPNGDTEDPGDRGQACMKSIQALRECSRLCLNGQGE